jgi:hypothetical protein
MNLIYSIVVYIGDKLASIGIVFLFAYLLMSLYCYIFKISYTYFFVYYIMPIFSLILTLIDIIITFIKFPYYITIEIWNIIVRIFSMFYIIIELINNISSFFYNLTIAI